MPAGQIADAFKAACRDELEALKPGNVHVFADGHRMTASDFVRSAEAAAHPLAQPGAKIGLRILRAVEATSAAVGTNTNLGIILLCAPLAAAAERRPSDMRKALWHVLDELDVEDAALAFRAITLAAPGGLGTAARHDVRAPATVSLRDAMAEAAERDSIARQYVSGFEDIFVTGAGVLSASRALPRNQATLAVFLAFLAAFPDSHIVRRHGLATAEDVRDAAARFRTRLQDAEPAHFMADLLAWDGELKGRGINPGTSADLTVATLFAARLRDVLASPRDGLPSRRNSG
jgi:triphosphoribosyl-dephospho-CoA synthase